MLARVFAKARQEAPCYLVFEDLDSIVTDQVRSFFLNEVDGLANNDGILMVGSTNHLDRLDPGISKRPSRFDRKHYFPIPDREERVKYCEYWQGKLSDNKDLDFPHRLCTAIADITDGFSFAYMQEAFVAALLIIAGRSNPPAGDGSSGCRGGQKWQESSDNFLNNATFNLDGSDLDQFILWREIKLQIKTLREGLEEKKNLPSPKASTLTETRIEGDPLHNGLEGLKNFPPLLRPDAPADNDAVHDLLRDDFAKTKEFLPSLHEPRALTDIHAPNNFLRDILEGRTTVRQLPKIGACGAIHGLHDYEIQLMLLEQQNKKRIAMTRQKQNNSADVTVAQGTQTASTGDTMKAPPISSPTHPNTETTFGAVPPSTLREKVNFSPHQFPWTPKHNHALQDPDLQLELLGEQDRKRLAMARQTRKNIPLLNVPQAIHIASTLQEKAPFGPSTPAPNTTTNDMGSLSSPPETTSPRKSATSKRDHAQLDPLEYQTRCTYLEQNSRFRLAMARLDGCNHIHRKEAQKIPEARTDHTDISNRREATLPTVTTVVGTDAPSFPEGMPSSKSGIMTGSQAQEDCSMQLTLLERAQKKRCMTQEQDYIAKEEVERAFPRARAALVKANKLYNLRKSLDPTSDVAPLLSPKVEHNLSPHRSTDGIGNIHAVGPPQ
jgi:ATPase family associated with various cellular activities (AAA)